MTDESTIRDALREVIDPELGFDVVALGMVRAIRVGVRVEVELVMTSPACPMGSMILEDAMDAVSAVVFDRPFDVRLVDEPPWSAEDMEPALRERLGWRR